MLCLHHQNFTNQRHDLAQDEHFRIFAEKANVQEWIEANYPPELRDMLTALLEAHPEWRRGPQETRSQYVARMRAIQAPLAGAVKRMPT